MRNAYFHAIPDTRLLRFFVQRALIIARAEFRVFHTARLLAFVLRHRIISHFAFGAFEGNDVSHDFSSVLTFRF